MLLRPTTEIVFFIGDVIVLILNRVLKILFVSAGFWKRVEASEGLFSLGNALVAKPGSWVREQPGLLK